MTHEQINNRPALKQRRQELRNNSPKAEKILWQLLKGGYSNQDETR